MCEQSMRHASTDTTPVNCCFAPQWGRGPERYCSALEPSKMNLLPHSYGRGSWVRVMVRSHRVCKVSKDQLLGLRVGPATAPVAEAYLVEESPHPAPTWPEWPEPLEQIWGRNPPSPWPEWLEHLANIFGGGTSPISASPTHQPIASLKLC